MPAETCPFAEVDRNCSLCHGCLFCGYYTQQEASWIDSFPSINMSKIPPSPAPACINPLKTYLHYIPDTLGSPVEPGFQEEISPQAEQANVEKSIAADRIILPKTRLTSQVEASNDEDEEDEEDEEDDEDEEDEEGEEDEASTQEASEYDEEEVSSKAKPSLQPSNSCVLCDEPGTSHNMVGCSLDSKQFHLNCVGLRFPPRGKWQCPLCLSNGSHAEAGTCQPRFSSAIQIDSRAQSRVPKAILPTKTPSKEDKHISSNVPFDPSGGIERTASPNSSNAAANETDLGSKSSKKEGWSPQEQAHVIALMKEIVNEGDTTENKWNTVSNRLKSRFAVNRSSLSVSGPFFSLHPTLIMEGYRWSSNGLYANTNTP